MQSGRSGASSAYTGMLGPNTNASAMTMVLNGTEQQESTLQHLGLPTSETMAEAVGGYSVRSSNSNFQQTMPSTNRQ